MIWTARRSGNRILCGVQDAAGRFVCQGELARYGGPGHVALEPGLTEDPPGHWRPTKAALRKAAKGERLIGVAGRGTVKRPPGSKSRPVAFYTTVAVPITIDCPHCGQRARVNGVL
jgi:hypothetical protein